MWTAEVLHVSNNVCLLQTGSKYMHRVSNARITAVLGCADAEASGG